MATRKSFLRVAPENAELDHLLAAAVKAGVSEEQLAEQRVSFAYGNAPADSDSSKDSVRKASAHNKLIGA
ncbi:MAG TPA: hypothetical protein VHZ26_17680 [Caulobacteraceae bacterium]|jgi:hypothetical protein|nr:hypothetical protein [Caulobacteraceae bacterium]